MIHIGEQIFYWFSHVALDLRSLVIDRPEDGKTRERDQRQRSRKCQHREPCRNA
jgi:hypothetical protein